MKQKHNPVPMSSFRLAIVAASVLSETVEDARTRLGFSTSGSARFNGEAYILVGATDKGARRALALLNYFGRPHDGRSSLFFDRCGSVVGHGAVRFPASL